MNKVINFLIIGGLSLLSACSTIDKPAEFVATNTSLSPTELPIDIVSTPSLTSGIFNTLTPSPMLTGTFSTTEVTPTIPLTPYIKMSKIGFPSGLVWLECEVSFDQYQLWRVADK